MTKLNSKLFNACTKCHRGTQPEHSIQHDGERGWNTSIAPAPAQCSQLRTCRPFHRNGTTGQGFSRTGLSPAFPWTHSYGNTAVMITRTMETSGSRSPGGWSPLSPQGARAGVPARPRPLPAGGPAPTAARRPGPAGGISGVKNQPHGQGHGELRVCP